MRLSRAFRSLLIYFLLAFLGSALADEARQENAAPCLSLEDHAEIVDLMSRYALYTDAGKGEAFASTFTEDGQLIIRDQPVQGRRNLAERVNQKKLRTLHLPSVPILVRVADESVRARSQLIYIQETRPDGISNTPSSPFVGFAVYEDTIVRTTDGWKFQERRAAETLPISPEFLVSPPFTRCQTHR